MPNYDFNYYSDLFVDRLISVDDLAFNPTYLTANTYAGVTFTSTGEGKYTKATVVVSGGLSQTPGDLSDATLIDYRVESITKGSDATAEIVTIINDGHLMKQGRAVSTDVVQGSVESFLNALNK